MGQAATENQRYNAVSFLRCHAKPELSLWTVIVISQRTVNVRIEWCPQEEVGSLAWENVSGRVWEGPS